MITDDVTTMLFEAACFDGTNIRLSSKKIGLRTDASGKFEKGLDPNNALDAINRACQLVEELGAGEVVGGVVDVYGKVKEGRRVPFDAEKINKLLGTLGNGKFRNWILKIAVNATKDYFKSNTYKQRSEICDIENHQIGDKSNVIDIISKKEESIKIKEAIKKLPNRQREAILLKYYNDLKIKEISNITGDNENTIKSRLFNGIKNLKKLLGGDIFEEKYEYSQSKM